MIEHFANKKELTGDEPLNPEAALNTLRETSLEKMKRREARLLEKASLLGNVSAMNRILDLIHASRKKVTLAVGAAALLSTSVAFAQDDTTTKKIANTPTLEAFGESDLPRIDLGIIETATSGLQSLVEDKMTTASDGFKKVIGGDSLRDKVDGLEQVTTGLPGKLGAISATIKLGKEITDEKNSNEERLESSGKILEIVGGKLGPLGSLLTSSMELRREIAEGKDGERIAFKFLKIIIGIKTAGLSNLISNTLITMAEKVTLSPALTLDQLNSSNTTETK